jgi:hypothetical protein
MSRGCASLLEPDCPIPRAHRRLEDAHRLWHQAAASYADPQAFRVGLNETLQALRGGTWALQRETRTGQDFQTWHDVWHRRIREDEVQSHRHSVTEEDLQPASSAQVTLMVKDQGEDRQLAAFSVPPLVSPTEIPKQLRDTRMGPLVRAATVMVVERQWRSEDLRGWELMTALSHCYGALADPLREAHEQHGTELDPLPMPKRLRRSSLPTRPAWTSWRIRLRRPRRTP